MLEDVFATAPVLAVKPLFRRDDEEELYTEFEQAISGRVIAVKEQLSRISGPLASGLLTTEPLSEPEELVHAEFVLPRNLVLFCVGLMLIFSGFDLFGLLLLVVTHSH